MDIFIAMHMLTRVVTRLLHVLRCKRILFDGSRNSHARFVKALIKELEKATRKP